MMERHRPQLDELTDPSEPLCSVCGALVGEIVIHDDTLAGLFDAANEFIDPNDPNDSAFDAIESLVSAIRVLAQDVGYELRK